ncbi:hypothetical protein M8C21_017932, partial [Ambrosia artemisiifolia]
PFVHNDWTRVSTKTTLIPRVSNLILSSFSTFTFSLSIIISIPLPNPNSVSMRISTEMGSGLVVEYDPMAVKSFRSMVTDAEDGSTLVRREIITSPSTIPKATSPTLKAPRNDHCSNRRSAAPPYCLIPTVLPVRTTVMS